MTVYYVDGIEYYSLREAKKAMKETGKPGTKYKIYANGDFVNCGEITLNGSNKSFIANTKMTKDNY